MTKEERAALQRRVERDTERRRELMEKQRSERAMQQRDADRRQAALNDLRRSLVSQHREENVKARTGSTTSAEQPLQLALHSEIQKPSAKPRKEPKDKLARRQAAAAPERQSRAFVEEQPLSRTKPQRPGAEPNRIRQERSIRRRADRRSDSQDRVRQHALRKQSAALRFQEQEALRARAEATRQSAEARRKEQAASRTADREAYHGVRSRRQQIRQAAALEKLQKLRDVRSLAQQAQASAGTLRRQQAVLRSGARSALEAERQRKQAARQRAAASRLGEHRQLRAELRASARQHAALRKNEATRRVAERNVPAPHSLQLAGDRPLADVSSVPAYEEPPDSLSWLRTVGPFISDEQGNGVTLRGVTVAGLDAVAPAPNQSLAEALSLDEANLSAMYDFWGFNLLRLPFKDSTVLSGNASLTQSDLLQGLDDVISAIAQQGMYTLLALQPDAIGPTLPLPDQAVFDCWTLLAQHYQDEPGVLFEIYSCRTPVSGDWISAAQVLTGLIRQQHPASLLFVGNGSGTNNTVNLPLRFTTGEPTPNIVYTTRVAPGSQFSPPDENRLSALTKSFPVIASDWSVFSRSEFDRAAEATANLFSREGLGWAAATWNAEPRLVRDSFAHDFVATRWGLAVQRALSLPTKQPLENLLK